MILDENLFNEVVSSYKVGDTIRIIEMKGEPNYTGKTGIIKHIDDMGQLHGTWGGLAIIPEEDIFEVVDTVSDTVNDTVNEAMYTNISSSPYDLNIMVSRPDDKAGRDWKYVKSFKFKDDAIERANRMIANGEAYVAQVYSWLDEDHGEIYFRKADDGKVIDKSAQRVDCEIHGPELRTKSDKTVIRPIREDKENTCSICGTKYTGYGNNAEPVNNGKCCDTCNIKVVIPARLKQLLGKDTLKESVNIQDIVLNDYQKQTLLNNLFEDEELHDFYTNKLNTEWIISSNKELDPIRTPEDDEQFPYVLIIDGEFVDALSANFANKYMNLTESVEGDKMMQDRIDDKNANFEADQQTTRNMRMKLADQGIATDTNGKPFVDESLNEDVTIATNASTENNGLATILNYLIKDEFDAIQQYNDAIVNFETEGRNDLVQVLKDIVNEENLHVGQLEVLLEQVSGVANSIDQGKAEAETQLAAEDSKVEEDPEEEMHY